MKTFLLFLALTGTAFAQNPIPAGQSAPLPPGPVAQPKIVIPQAPITEPDPATAGDSPIPGPGETPWVNPQPFCGPAIDQMTQASLGLARAMSVSISKGLGCNVVATKGAALQLLAQALQINTYADCPARDGTSGQVLAQIQKDADIQSGLSDYAGFKLLLQGLTMGSFTAYNAPADLMKLASALSGSEYYLESPELYSRSMEIHFLDGGLADVQEDDNDAFQWYLGHWTLSVQPDPTDKYNKLVVLELKVHGRVEHLIVEGEFGQFWKSVRLRNLTGTKFSDPWGWVGEVRACAQ